MIVSHIAAWPQLGVPQRRKTEGSNSGTIRRTLLVIRTDAERGLSANFPFRLRHPHPPIDQETSFCGAAHLTFPFGRTTSTRPLFQQQLPHPPDQVFTPSWGDDTFPSFGLNAVSVPLISPWHRWPDIFLIPPNSQNTRRIPIAIA